MPITKRIVFEESLFTFTHPEDIVVKVTTGKTGYILGTNFEPTFEQIYFAFPKFSGESIQMTAKVKNKNFCGIILRFKLYQRQTYFVRDDVKSEKTVAVENANVESEIIGPRTESTHYHLCLPIPDSITPTIKNCRVMKVDYEIHVKNPCKFDDTLFKHVIFTDDV